MDPTERFLLSLLGPLPERIPGVEWERALELLRLHRLGPLAAAEDRATGGALLPDEIREELEAEYRATALRNTLLMEAAAAAREALGSAGVPSLLFKGGALLASGAYPDPGARPMDDVDLLVPWERASDAVRALREAGFRPWEEWSEEKPRWVDAAAFTAGGSPGGVPLEIDLHWRTRYGGLRFGGSGGGSILLEEDHGEDGLPASEPHLVVVAEHVLKHVRYLVHFHGLADLTRLAGEIGDWERVAGLAAGRRSAPGIGVVLGMAREGVGAPIPGSVVESLRPRTIPAALARRLLEPERLLGRLQPVEGRAGGLLVRGLLAGSVPAALRDLAEAAVPGEGWLRARYEAGPGAGGPASGREEASTSPEGDGIEPSPVWRLRLRYLADVARWLGYRGRSPASPNQRFFDPRARR